MVGARGPNPGKGESREIQVTHFVLFSLLLRKGLLSEFGFCLTATAMTTTTTVTTTTTAMTVTKQLLVKGK
mgnify:CR=1 FL=1